MGMDSSAYVDGMPHTCVSFAPTEWEYHGCETCGRNLKGEGVIKLSEAEIRAAMARDTTDCGVARQAYGRLLVERHPASQRFHDILAELGKLHDKKQADYGRTDDPFANVRASEDFGIKGWIGALARANDKMRRLQKAATGSTLANEGIVDSLNDLAVYAMIARVLYEELNQQGG